MCSILSERSYRMNSPNPISSFTYSNTHRLQFSNSRVEACVSSHDFPVDNWNVVLFVSSRRHETVRHPSPFVCLSPLSISPSEHDFPSTAKALRGTFHRHTKTQSSRLFSEPSPLFAGIRRLVSRNRCARVSRIFHSPLTPERAGARRAEN